MRRVILVAVGQCVADQDPAEVREGVIHGVGVRVLVTLGSAEAEDGKGRHRGPRATPAIPEFRLNPVILLS